MTPLALTTLAADCEARAKAGEKPVMEWMPDGDCWSHMPEFGVAVSTHGDTDIPEEWVMRRLSGGHGGGQEFSVMRSHPALSSIAAAQLFAEALLADATAPLHAARVKALEERIEELEAQVADGSESQALAFESGFDDARKGEHELFDEHGVGVELPPSVEDGYDLPVCRFGWYKDNGDSSAGIAAQQYWALLPNQEGTMLALVIARIAALEAALAEAKDVACAERNRLDGEQATRWNDLAVRWQDALAGEAPKADPT